MSPRNLAHQRRDPRVVPAREGSGEGEVQGGLSFGTDGSYEGYKTYASVGTKQKGYYLQASGTLIDSDGWMLSEKFTPTSVRTAACASIPTRAIGKSTSRPG